MKKLIPGMFVVLSALVSCSNDEVLDIKLNKTVSHLELRDTLILEALVTPKSSEKIVWQSSRPEVATVAAGVVVAAGEGETKITATIGKNTAVCQIYVTPVGGTYYGEYKLVWSEEFNGTELDTDTWNVENKGGGFGNRESQFCSDRPENLRVENGNLIIEVRKEQYQNHNYTSARINTSRKQDFLYGKIEARISLPKGGGTWPAFWMMGYEGGWPLCGEIDIMEHVGNNPTRVTHALHTRKANGMTGTNWHASQTVENIENEFHVYGIEWLQNYEYGRDAIRFYVNDKVSAIRYAPLNEDREEWPFINNFYIILNVALGGVMGGAIDDTIFSDPNNPVMMKVDWVRVYQKSL